jgi:hypothetical protein
MLRTAFRLLAAGDASRRLGDYAKNLTARYLILGLALMPLLVAGGFAVLAGYWAIDSWMQNPVWAALIMAGICLLAGSLIALIAFGITREKPSSVRAAVGDPYQAAQSPIPSVEDIGREIETAVERYGPLPVAAVAAAGGLVAGLLAKRFSQPRVVYEYEPPRSRRYRRR